MPELYEIYQNIKSEIDEKEKMCQIVWDLGDNEIFLKLIFSLCTPQTNAQYAWDAVKILSESGYLHQAIHNEVEKQQRIIQISQILSNTKVRFKKNKSKYIVQAIQRFNSGFPFKTFLINQLKNSKDIFELRNWLAKNIYGMGMKEASHFLRNIGLGQNVCILDRHILRNLEEYGVIERIPQNLSKKIYLQIEQEMIKFSKEINIPVFALDYVFWYKSKGELFNLK